MPSTFLGRINKADDERFHEEKVVSTVIAGGICRVVLKKTVLKNAISILKCNYFLFKHITFILSSISQINACSKIAKSLYQHW